MLKIEKKLYVTVDEKGFMTYVDEAELIPNVANRIKVGDIFMIPNNIAWEICFPHGIPKEQGMYCIPIMFCIQGMRDQVYALDCQPIQGYTICDDGVGIEYDISEKIPA